MALTPQDVEIIRLRCSQAATLHVVSMLIQAVAQNNRETHGRLVDGLERIEASAQVWTKPDTTPDESMLIAGIYAEECEVVARGMKKLLGVG